MNSYVVIGASSSVVWTVNADHFTVTYGDGDNTMGPTIIPR